MAFNARTPYNALPLLPPKKTIESTAVLKKALSAARSLAELKGLGLTIPNQAILINSLILQEAKASSEIENIVTTNDALFQAFSAGIATSDPATKEVLRYREALWEGYKALQKRPLLTTNVFVRLAQTIKENTAGIRTTPGTAIAHTNTGRIIYTPPEGETIIRDKLKNLEEFIHTETRMDPLVKLALLHYQFEAIHPFADGNGRTGRILNILFLVQQDLLDLPVLYLSKFIIDNKNEYYRLLRTVTERGDWEAWILFMLTAVETTALHTRERIVAIRSLLEKTVKKARRRLPPRVYSKELIELLFHQPYTKVQFLVEANIAQRQTAADYLRELETIGIVKSQKVGKENLYLNGALFKLLSS